jgi:hypothetical protein
MRKPRPPQSSKTEQGGSWVKSVFILNLCNDRAQLNFLAYALQQLTIDLFEYLPP